MNGFSVLTFHFNEAPSRSLFGELFELFKQAKRVGKVRVVLNLKEFHEINADVAELLDMEHQRLRDYGGGIHIVSRSLFMIQQLTRQGLDLLVFPSEEQAIDKFRRLT